jgi:hypothetical protein
LTDRKKYLLSAVLCCFASFGFAQDEHGGEFDSLTNAMNHPAGAEEEREADGQQRYFDDTIRKRDFNKAEWERITDGLDYREERERPKKEEAVKQDDPTAKERRPPPVYHEPPSSTGLLGGSGILQVMLIILAAAALGALLFFFFRGKVSNTKVERKGSFSIEEIEEALHESDLERFLREAIEKKEYRLAVRIYYLMAIKELSERNWISWKKDKTNNQYLFEMSQRPNFTLFREITRLFEYTWYGDMTVGEMQFHAIDPRFRQFLNELKNIPA